MVNLARGPEIYASVIVVCLKAMRFYVFRSPADAVVVGYRDEQLRRWRLRFGRRPHYEIFKFAIAEDVLPTEPADYSGNAAGDRCQRRVQLQYLSTTTAG